MNLFALVTLIYAPTRGWQRLANSSDALFPGIIGTTLLVSAIPPLFWFYGTTQAGWTVGDGDPVRLTVASALPICLLFYMAIVGGLLFLAFMANWMAGTYAGSSNPGRALKLVVGSAMPFCLAGLLGIYPAPWIDIAIGAGVAAWCIALLHIGVPIVFETSPERGFLYVGATVLVGLVGFVAVMSATVILWDLGVNPEFTH